MSQIHVLIVKDNRVWFAKVHYRSAIKMLEKNLLPRSSFLDAGYVICDWNNKLIINGQNAFAVKKRGFEIIET